MNRCFLLGVVFVSDVVVFITVPNKLDRTFGTKLSSSPCDDSIIRVVVSSSPRLVNSDRGGWLLSLSSLLKSLHRLEEVDD